MLQHQKAGGWFDSADQKRMQFQDFFYMHVDVTKTLRRRSLSATVEISACIKTMGVHYEEEYREKSMQNKHSNLPQQGRHAPPRPCHEDCVGRTCLEPRSVKMQ